MLSNPNPGDWHTRFNEEFLAGNLDRQQLDWLLEVVTHEGRHMDQPDEIWRLPKDHPVRVKYHRELEADAFNDIAGHRERFRLELPERRKKCPQ